MHDRTHDASTYVYLLKATLDLLRLRFVYLRVLTFCLRMGAQRSGISVGCVLALHFQILHKKHVIQPQCIRAIEKFNLQFMQYPIMNTSCLSSQISVRIVTLGDLPLSTRGGITQRRKYTLSAASAAPREKLSCYLALAACSCCRCYHTCFCLVCMRNKI